MCSSGEDEACAVIEDCVEYAHYDTHVRNEEIYQDLCSIDKHATPALFVSYIFKIYYLLYFLLLIHFTFILKITF